MERHRCKLCFRKFANGRALGGHMRSHMLNHSVASKPDSPAPPPPQLRMRTPSWSETESPPPSSVSHFLSSSDSEHEDEVEFATHDNDELIVAEPTGSSSLVTSQDRESETESFRKKNHPTRKRRSKRILQKPASSTSFDYHYFDHQQRQHYVRGCRKSSGSSAVDVEADLPVSSITEVTSEEDLAFCLMMMSRDKWNSSVGKRTTATTKNNNNKKMKYKCDTCNKGFRSYQALGGHRASHKKIRVNESEQRADNTNEDENRVDDGSDSMMIKKVHECPICLRVFASGQALGGHKRSHVLVSNNGVDHNNLLDNSKITKITTRDSLIDLNLPASVEDEDDSAVSDVHF
ncbi:zinc finger protein ZAT9-like [Chenopodium quinoa]|uniref:C2H2-type domain-containing protein n=1 Tax=Chenopodium quinoa TaxID=63459 RepID=A0A803LI91_CHEQI|nr:zinc finger protein ZAT9-like [Chenopodium quinoa]